MEENSFVEIDIYFRPEVKSIYEVAHAYGLNSNRKVEVRYADSSPSMEFGSYADFLETKEENSNIEFLKFFADHDPDEIIYYESVTFRLLSNHQIPMFITVINKDGKIDYLSIPVSYTASITKNNYRDTNCQGLTKRENYLYRNDNVLEDYLEFYEGYDYSYTKDLRIYKESQPCHYHRSMDYFFISSCQMYYSTEHYYKVIPKPLWDAFSDCEENVVLENGLRKISLYKDYRDYKKPENRQRQWAFRRQLGIDSIAHEICKDQDKEPVELPVVITKKNCIKGSTKVTRYLDESNNLVNPSKATTKEIKEYLEDGITVVFEEKVTI